MKKTKFNWRCVHCSCRNITPLSFQFDIPKRYIGEWNCNRCGKITKITFTFDTDLPEEIKNVI